MKVLISGATGLVGTALTSLLKKSGDQVVPISRRLSGQDAIQWDPESGQLDARSLDGVDAVVHLAGENLASARWTAEQKARIRGSRTQGTRLLAQTISQLAHPPSVLVSASAIGYYGSRGAEQLDEASGPGTGFLAEVCTEWEAAAQSVLDRGVRVVHPRIGMVLASHGGALAKMLLPFKLGVGGIIGSGEQFMSWISLDDLTAIFRNLLTNEIFSGPVNAVAPGTVTNREFTKTLGRVLKRPTIFPMPSFAARLAFGEMAEELLLSSARVLPKRLSESGYNFRYPELEGALKFLLRGS